MKFKFKVINLFTTIVLVGSFLTVSTSSSAEKKNKKQIVVSKNNKTEKKSRKPNNQTEDEIFEWDRILNLAINGDVEAIVKVLDSGKGLSGFQAAEYGLNLIKVYKNQPLKLIQINREKHLNNDSCLLWWLVPETQEIQFSEVQQPLVKIISNPIAKSFYNSAVKYKTAISKSERINYDGCKFF